MFTIRSLGLMFSVVLSLPVLARGEDKPATAPASNMTEQILFVSSRDQERGLAIDSMNPDGSEPKRLTEKGKTAFAPVFSPNRTQIAFALVERGGPRIGRIFSVDAEGPILAQFETPDETSGTVPL